MFKSWVDWKSWYHTICTFNIVLGFLSSMEANFSFHTNKKLVPFLRQFTNKRLKGLFLFKDERLYESVKMLLGEEIVHVGHRYRTNMEAYSLIFAWGFQFEDEVDKVKNALRVVIDSNDLLNMDSACACVVPKVGIVPNEGVVGQVAPLPLIRWANDDLKERCKSLSWHG